MTQIHIRQGTLDRVRDDLDIASRDELARRLGVSSTAAWRIDSGRVTPSTKFIAALINLTGQSFEDLFDVEEEEVVA